MELFMLLTPEGRLSLAVICQTFEQAKQELAKEYPPGELIFPGYRIVRVRLQILDAF